MEIVDRAQKELSIEKALQKMSDTWSTMVRVILVLTVNTLRMTLQELSYQPHADSDVQLMQYDDAVIEALENDTVAMQAMSAAPHVQVGVEFLWIADY